MHVLRKRGQVERRTVTRPDRTSCARAAVLRSKPNCCELDGLVGYREVQVCTRCSSKRHSTRRSTGGPTRGSTLSARCWCDCGISAASSGHHVGNCRACFVLHAAADKRAVPERIFIIIAVTLSERATRTHTAHDLTKPCSHAPVQRKPEREGGGYFSS